MNTAEEYYKRIIRLKPIIEANPEILRKAWSTIAFMTMYRMFPKDVVPLGMGRIHGVGGIGKILDPLTNQEMYLAVRANHNTYYQTPEMLAEQIGAYETAFEAEQDPPYFIGAIKAETEAGIIYSMIMEDISQAKRLPLQERPDDDFCEVVLETGILQRRFIDQSLPTDSDCERGMKYLEDIARIDVRFKKKL